MEQTLAKIKATAQQEVAKIGDLATLEDWRVKYLGRKAELNRLLRSLTDLSVTERQEQGAAANQLKQELEWYRNRILILEGELGKLGGALQKKNPVQDFISTKMVKPLKTIMFNMQNQTMYKIG